METLLQHGTMFYSQRMPAELGRFEWTVDAKDRTRVTDWEDWWSGILADILQSRSLSRPLVTAPDGDYSAMQRFEMRRPDWLPISGDEASDGEGWNLAAIVNERFAFSAEPEPGLELVDILTTTVRRALTGHLDAAAWRGIRRLMVHRRGNYVRVIAMRDATVREIPYASALRELCHGGRPMRARA